MLALICGAGALPAHVAAALEAPPVVCALQGFAPDDLTPEITFRIETLGSLIAWLKARGVTALCLCGHIRRPQIDIATLDAATAPLVPRLKQATELGDDGALRVVLALFAEAGFEILAAHEAAPDLLPPPGVPTRAQPPEGVRDAAQAGDAEIARLAAADAGQACVIRDGRVIASEGPDGTDAMLAGLTRPEADDPFSRAVDRVDDVLGQAADWLSNASPAPAFLFKAPKPGQDRRVDLPVIGPGTAAALARSGLSGAVIEAGGVMVLDRARTIADFDAAGLFLWVRERPA
ncbi:LpxI family protein [Citreimonas sp.]|uniref:LpxI family protein n=1 Tax=Citreimonas sp. TaxID=3036715 RepID=UPI004059A15F